MEIQPKNAALFNAQLSAVHLCIRMYVCYIYDRYTSREVRVGGQGKLGSCKLSNFKLKCLSNKM